MLENELKTLTLSDVHVHSGSGMDFNGILFEKDGHLYRALCEYNAKLYQKLFDEGIVESLIKQGLLVETWVAPVAMVHHPLVLEHKRLPILTYPCEWTPQAFKAATCMVLDLEIELARQGLSLHDPHPWNVVFDGPSPRFVDFGAIMPETESLIWPAETGVRDPRWPALSQYEQLMVRPLTIMHWGFAGLARQLLMDYMGVGEKLYRALDPSRSSLKNVFKKLLTSLGDDLRRWPLVDKIADHAGFKKLGIRIKGYKATKAEGSNNRNQRLSYLTQLRSRLDALLPLSSNLLDRPSIAEERPHNAELDAVIAILARLKPASLIDLASGQGWVALEAARLGIRAIDCYTNERQADVAYLRARSHHLNIVPVMMNLRSPTPAVGVVNKWLKPASERLCSEMALIIGVLDELVFSSSTTFSQITETLDLFCTKWALVEYRPRDGISPVQGGQQAYDWYTPDNLASALAKRFDKVERVSDTTTQGILFLCTKTS